MMRRVERLIESDRIRIGNDWYVIVGSKWHILGKRIKLKLKAIDEDNVVGTTSIVLHQDMVVETTGTATDALRSGWGASGR